LRSPPQSAGFGITDLPCYADINLNEAFSVSS